jgi:hypothetical protein
MNVKRSLKTYLILAPGLLGNIAFAHNVPVHQAITSSAAAVSYANSANFSSFIKIIASDGRLFKDASNSMVGGSAHEDDPPGTENPDPTDGGGYRSLNHFYDPVYNNQGRGLSDSPFLLVLGGDSRYLLGTNSFAWASVSNCVGVKTLLYSRNPTNTYSWQNARYYEWLGLTASNRLARQTNLDNMFRAVGQVMHLLEDTSQPQHVRNEQHVDRFGKLFWESPIEDYGIENYTNNPQWFVLPPDAIVGWQNWQAAGFNKLEDFWDRHLYAPGNTPALTAAENGGDQLGLAEWCNGNFLGDRHSYSDFFAPGEIEYYPHPAFADTTFKVNPYNNPGITIAPVTLDSGKSGNRAYISKTVVGVPVEFHSALTYFAVKHPPRLNLPGMKIGVTIRDNNVLANYHDLLIPKAVEYSAGLVDYYFRGDISAKITDYSTNTMQYSISVQNISIQEDFGHGTFYFYQQNTNGVRALSTNVTMDSVSPGGILTSGNSVMMQAPGPLPIGGQFICIYRGNIGVNGSANALDPVDANIAISATTCNERTMSFDLTYDNPKAEVDLYLTDPCNTTHYEPDRTNITSTCCNVDGGDEEDESLTHQHMVVSDMTDGDYILWVNYEDGTNSVNCTLVTTSAYSGVVSTNTFTLNARGSGADGLYWPIGVSGPAMVDTNGAPSTINASWYVRKAITISNGKPVSY